MLSALPTASLALQARHGPVQGTCLVEQMVPLAEPSRTPAFSPIEGASCPINSLALSGA